LSLQNCYKQHNRQKASFPAGFLYLPAKVDNYQE